MIAERGARRARSEGAPERRAELRDGPADERDGVRVGIVTDWTVAPPRGQFWTDLLAELAPRLPTKPTIYELGNRSVAHPVAATRNGVDPGAGFFVERCQVLILNWDVVNGDPDFGADFAQRWFHHRRREILLWVEAGGVLIIESQTVLGAAAQEAYDALLGPGEVLVSAPEDEVAPAAEWRRSGSKCRYTRAARKSRLFRNLREPECVEGRTFAEMFPGSAQGLLTSRIRGEKRRDLYRGWFRWNPARRTRLHWVPILKTADRRFDHPTLLAAKHEDGAIFVSTMLVSAARQLDLAGALLQAATNASALPDRPRRLALVQNLFTRILVSLVAASGLAAAASGVFGESWIFQGLLSALLVAAVGLVGALVFVAPRRLWRLARDVLGW